MAASVVVVVVMRMQARHFLTIWRTPDHHDQQAMQLATLYFHLIRENLARAVS